jgi:TatA/E family protein of Tat protein translocase
MDFLGIGPLELVLILIVLLIVVGPAKLPEVAAAIGRGMRKFRQATTELTRDFQDMATEAKDVGKEVSETVAPGSGLTTELKEVAKEIRDVGKEVRTALKPDEALTRGLKEMGKDIMDVGRDIDTSLKPDTRSGRKPGGTAQKAPDAAKGTPETSDTAGPDSRVDAPRRKDDDIDEG